VVVSGAYYLHGETLQIHAAVTDVVAGKLLHSLRPVEGPVAEPMVGIEELGQRIMGLLAGREYLDLLSHSPRFEAYQEFLAGIDVFGRDNTRALAHFERAAAADPDFAAPLLYAVYLYTQADLHECADEILAELQDRRPRLSPYEQLWLDVHLAGRERNYTEVLRLLRRAQERAPRDILIGNWIGVCALRLNRPRLADEALSDLDPERLRDHMSSLYVPQVHASALHMLGEHERELEVARQGIAWHPDSMGSRLEAVSALAALGRIDEMDRAIQSSLELVPAGEYDVIDVMLTASRELRAHGYREDSIRVARGSVDLLQERARAEGSSAALREDLGEALYRAERWDEARETFADLSGGEAGDIDHLGRLGTLAARAGDEREARRLANELAAVSRPYLWGRNTMWRARIAALLGAREETMALIREAFAQGYSAYFYLHCDMDLESLRDYPPYQELSSPRD
jgi:tetratricopeptide (TPR) repeat protein